MNKKQVLKMVMSLGILGGALQSCTSVKAYQKTYLNDADMELASRKVEKMEQSFFLYREGSSGANGGKNGGGCGCN